MLIEIISYFNWIRSSWVRHSYFKSLYYSWFLVRLPRTQHIDKTFTYNIAMNVMNDNEDQ